MLDCSQNLVFQIWFIRLSQVFGFGGHRRDVLERDLPAERARVFDLHQRGIAGLLRNFLVRRGLVAHIERLGRVRRKEENPRFFRDAQIGFVQNGAAKGEPLEIARLAVRVGAGENPIPFRQAAIKQFLPHEQFLRQFGDLVRAVAEDQQQLVKLGAFHLEFLAGHLVAHITALAVVRHLEGLERHRLGVHFLVPGRFRGEARVLRPIFGQQRFQAADDIFRQPLQILARLVQFRLGPLHFLAVPIDVKKRDAADTHLQQPLHVRVRQVPDQLLLKGLKPSKTDAVTASLVLHCSILL